MGLVGCNKRRFWWCIASTCAIIIISIHDSMAFSGNTGGAFMKLLKDTTRSEEYQRVGTAEEANQATDDGKIHQRHAFVPFSGPVDVTPEREAPSKPGGFDSLQDEIDSMYGKEEGLLHQIEMARLELEQEESKLKESIEESRRKSLAEARAGPEKLVATLKDTERETLILFQQEVARRKMLEDRLGYQRKKSIEKTKKEEDLIRTKQELARRHMMTERFSYERARQDHSTSEPMSDLTEQEDVAKSQIAEVGSQTMSENAPTKPGTTRNSREFKWLKLGEKEAKIRAGRQGPSKETTIESARVVFDTDRIQTDQRNEGETKQMSTTTLGLDREGASKQDSSFMKRQELARRSMMGARFQFKKVAAEVRVVGAASVVDRTRDRIEHVTKKEKTQYPYFAKVLKNMDHAQQLTDKLESVMVGEEKVDEEIYPPNQGRRIGTTILAVERMMKDQEEARKAEAKIRFERDAAIAKAVDEAWIEAEADRIRGEQEVCRRKMLQSRLLSEDKTLQRTREAKAKRSEAAILTKALIKTQQEEARRTMMAARFHSEREIAKEIANQAVRVEREQYLSQIRAEQEACREKMLQARLQYEKVATMKVLELEQIARENAAAEEKDHQIRVEQELALRKMLEARLQYPKDTAARSAEPIAKPSIPIRFRQAYDLWCDHYSKVYDESRLPTFQQNVLRVEAYYKFKGDPIKLNERENIAKINEYADRTMEEFKELTAAAKRKSEKERIAKEIAAEKARLEAIGEAAEAARIKAAEDERIAMEEAAELKLLEEERVIKKRAAEEASLKVLQEAARRQMLKARLQYEKETAIIKAREAATKQVMALMQEESARRKIVEDRLQAEKEEAAANVKAKIAQGHAEQQQEESKIQFETRKVTPDKVVIDATITHREEVVEKETSTPRHAMGKLDSTVVGRSHHAPKQFVRGPTAYDQSRRSGYKPREWNIEWKARKDEHNTPTAASSPAASFEPNIPGQSSMSTRRHDTRKQQGWNIEWNPNDVSPQKETVVSKKAKEAESDDLPTQVTAISEVGEDGDDEEMVKADPVASNQKDKSIGDPTVTAPTKPRIRLQSNEQRRGFNGDRKFGW